VIAVEVRDIVLPDSMKRAMAGQAESERERGTKIINAQGEFQAAEKPVHAAAMISGNRPPCNCASRGRKFQANITPQPFCRCQLICLRRSPKGPKAEHQTYRNRHIECRRGIHRDSSWYLTTQGASSRTPSANIIRIASNLATVVLIGFFEQVDSALSTTRASNRLL
jgi:hypothetical protein